MSSRPLCHGLEMHSASTFRRAGHADYDDVTSNGFNAEAAEVCHHSFTYVRMDSAVKVGRDFELDDISSVEARWTGGRTWSIVLMTTILRREFELGTAAV